MRFFEVNFVSLRPKSLSYGEKEVVAQQFLSLYYLSLLRLEKPLNFDPFGHARFAHLFVLYD